MRLALCLLFLAARLTASTWDIALVPATDLSAPAGSALGWGYSMTNQSVTDWLVITSFYADPVAFASPAPVFDFPFLPPGQSASAPWVAGVSGILEWTWDALAPPGTTANGILRLEADWYSDSPLNGGVSLGPADAIELPFQLSVDPQGNVTPEPGTLSVAALGLAIAALRRGLR